MINFKILKKTYQVLHDLGPFFCYAIIQSLIHEGKHYFAFYFFRPSKTYQGLSIHGFMEFMRCETDHWINYILPHESIVA